ncbi:MAG: ATP-dependent DNA helicase RecG [Pseudomonadota bacterium]|nr:ATP-dependent DNA helicase RecG [Pseudomonadota bacterium]MDP1906352.1 ATP-dependent DNA helicase RecG [Pseudomonadota bacterium]MDP2351820.1 ATP-dependent DNA helicase RecG [Pseudomonadota bacterium]
MQSETRNPKSEIAHKLGYASPADLILHLPLRYEDETRITPLRDARLGDTVQVEGVVVHSEVQNRPRRQLVAEMVDSADDQARLHFRLLHFYPSQVALLKPGTRVRLRGEIRPGFFGAEMVHPQFRVVREGAPLPDRLTPVYPAVAALSQYALRKAVAAALAEADLDDPLPAPAGFPSFSEALRELHQPPPDADLAALEARDTPAWRRLKYDELLAQQLSLRLAARQRQTLRAAPLPDDGGLSGRLLAPLPFALTAAQQRALNEIRRDLAQPLPMNRLLQGDVGSGKTLVAALAVLPALAAGHQAAVMAPTEILAEQLYLKFHEWLTPLDIEVAWLTAALKGKAKQATLADIADGRARIAVGTHALFQNDVVFHDLAVVVVDEQHRFGVAQRLALREKGAFHPSPPGGGAGGEGSKALTPHLLMMSATPIPRSLAMSYYADLDVSVIDELPPGRTPITTRTISANRRDEVIARLRDYCLSGAQAYWVCPLVEESEKLQLRAAEESHAELVALLPELNIGLVHGRMKSDAKAAVMTAFKAGELHLLVATTVIEVGVDVPNAALMVIEHAERYGLAQLHQLRGRVGRGTRESSCVLLYENALSDTARQRLKIIHDNNDGFAIARADLQLRGPGEFLGARQSGQQLLRFADPTADADLLELARNGADELLERHPERVKRHLARWLPRGLDLFRA